LLARIHAFVPVPTILEIGPGQGRWTQYLKQLCDQLILVDVAAPCIYACRQRFAEESHIAYHVGDGKSLSPIPDHSVDFIFSFDSLVHAEADVLDAYIREFARVLRPDGVGFIHHSNMGTLRPRAALARALPPRLRRALIIRGLAVNVHAWRALSATGEQFAQSCKDAGLAPIGQERIAWEFGRYLTDAISLFTPRGSRWERPNVVTSNPDFIAEARLVAAAQAIYARASFRGADDAAQRAQGSVGDEATSRSSST
jgi:ubiquinone/menaquinone biosynthesis C-methylase UbiE